MKTFDVPRNATCRSLRWIAGLLLGAAALAGHASDFYRLTIIAESSSQAGADWRIVPFSVGINDAGMVTWDADRLVNGAFQRGIFRGQVTASGATQELILSSSSALQMPSINKLGQIAFTTSVPNPQVPGGLTPAVRYWDPANPSGTLSDLCIAGQQPNPLFCFSESLSDNTRVAYRRSTTGLPFGIVAPVNQVVSATGMPEANFAEFPPVISRDGLNSAWSGGAGGVTNRIVMNGPSISGRVDLVFPSPSTYRLSGLSINDRGNTAFVAGTSLTANPLVGVVVTRAGVGSVVEVAKRGAQFSDFLHSPAINNLNEVVFIGRIAFGGGVRDVLFVGDVSGRSPTQVNLPNEIIAPDGTTIGGIGANSFFPHGVNAKGQLAFFTTLFRPGTGPGTGSRNAIVLADPLPGVSPSNPILPVPGASLPSGWRFALNCNPASLCVGTGPRRYIDPPLAVGYTYTVEGGPNFASVYIPAPLPNGDETFQVEFNGQVAPLRAGEEFNFTSSVPGGVSTFRITGIDTTEALDPTNATAFVTGLTFVSDSVTDYSVTMVPIVQDPNDTDLDGVPNASDLCPNTAPGATVDANGCSADQRDSDRDGVVDSRDQCPATPLGSTVDANGCSAAQLDADGDGVPNTADQCPGTAPGAIVDASGCSADQRDSDGDGVADSRDQCPGTPLGSVVDANGCSAVQLDADGDGVPNTTDACPNTAAGATVDSRGCSAAQRDTDGDGVNDSADQCPNTPAGAAVNSAGCAASQLDSDGDGVTDNLDVCPATAPGTAVDSTGCPLLPPTTKICDVNADSFIDYRDIGLILIVLGQPAKGTSDPRDANRNGKIDLYDAALCTKQCTRSYCLPAK